MNEPIFQKAFKTAELANLNQEQYENYEKNLIDYWSAKAVLETAIEQGREQGREEGAQQKALEIARALKHSGLPATQIAAATGLPTDTIQRL